MSLRNKQQNTAAQSQERTHFGIVEVCDLVGVQPHVLRYWETEFPMLTPQKNRAGRRTYSRRDIEIALRIKELLYEELYTIAGAKKKLLNDLREPLKLVDPPKLRIITNRTNTETAKSSDVFTNQLSEANILSLAKIELPEKLQEMLAILIELEREKIVDENESILLDELMQIYEKFLLIKSRALRIAVDRKLIEPCS
ncbi:MAG TPA: MerR family transcriptional regulator [Pyrinomonadaceae bacterium]|jgi:DNA-binding transcriptional MerR regulator